MERVRLLFIFLLLVMASACATPMSPVAAPGQRTITEEFFARQQPADEALFFQGLTSISEALQKNDYSAVKHPLSTLINNHPKSKWRDSADMLLRLIGELELCHYRLRAEEAARDKNLTDKTKTLQENEQLKRDIRLLNEKFQAELTVLQQENEQLKKDLQLLKDLEMQLDKREKMLR
jgi:hypothetical protein